MRSTLSHYRRRRIARRALHTPCQAVALEGFRLLGEQALDLSPYGMLIASETQAKKGEPVVVSFKVGREWFDAEAEVARVVEGNRATDPGYCLGLRFTWIPVAARLALHRRLRGMPPPVPARPVRMNYASMVEDIVAG